MKLLPGGAGIARSIGRPCSGWGGRRRAAARVCVRTSRRAEGVIEDAPSHRRIVVPRRTVATSFAQAYGRNPHPLSKAVIFPISWFHHWRRHAKLIKNYAYKFIWTQISIHNIISKVNTAINKFLKRYKTFSNNFTAITILYTQLST